jgi:mannitol-1-phosphate 5-dehydrogenase
MKAVIYGAGNIGRGFIGQILGEAGYDLAFIDVQSDVVNELNEKEKYPVRLLSGETYTDHWVGEVRAVNGNDADKASDAIASADIMATAVGVRVLPYIAPLVAEGLRRRFQMGAAPLNIIICENLIDANKLLEKLLLEKLPLEAHEIFAQTIGLVEASIGRMVPIQTPEMKDGNPLRICTESYGYIPIDADAMKGPPVEIAGIVPCEKFDFYIKRKLFIHNMGHAVCAYLGMLLGDTYIWQAITRPEIRVIVENAMLESSLALSKSYSKPLADIVLHIKDLLRRFSNKQLGDTCQRVGADTTRKLGTNDRLIGAMRFCEAESIIPSFIAIGGAAGLLKLLDELNLRQDNKSALSKLKEIYAVDANPVQQGPETELMLEAYSILHQGFDYKTLVIQAERSSACAVM